MHTHQVLVHVHAISDAHISTHIHRYVHTYIHMHAVVGFHSENGVSTGAKIRRRARKSLGTHKRDAEKNGECHLVVHTEGVHVQDADSLFG